MKRFLVVLAAAVALFSAAGSADEACRSKCWDTYLGAIDTCDSMLLICKGEAKIKKEECLKKCAEEL